MTSAKAAATSSRIAVLQVLRAFAALLVAQTHVVDVIIARHAFAWQASFRHFENFGAVGVDIFFVVSGFIVPLTTLAPAFTRRQFMLRRILRIYPIWWIALVAWLIQTRLERHSLDWHKLIRSALLLPATNPGYSPVIYLGWTLIFEMFFYTLIIVAWGKRAETRLRWILVAVAALGVIGVVVHPSFPMSHLISNPILLEFCGGVLIGILWTSGRMLPAKAGLAFLATGIAALLATGYIGFGNISEMQYIISGNLSALRVLLWGLPSALIVFGALTLAPHCHSRAGRALVALGDASYSIYLTSFFTRILLYRMWRFIGWMPGDVAIVAGIAVVALTGVIVYRFVELPVLNFLKRLTIKRPAKVAVEVSPVSA
jgi:peptidoglycan/LPS O-acetylase OafA/YrhL